MSGYLPDSANWKITDAGVKTPLAMFHGKDDQVVKLKWAQNSYEKIKNAKIQSANMKVYEGLEHSVTEDELSDVVEFITTCMKK